MFHSAPESGYRHELTIGVERTLCTLVRMAARCAAYFAPRHRRDRSKLVSDHLNDATTQAAIVKERWPAMETADGFFPATAASSRGRSVPGFAAHLFKPIGLAELSRVVAILN